MFIPLSELSKLQKYGVRKFKPYNDARKLLKEKYSLEVVDDEVLGKCIVIEKEQDWQNFFAYFIEELLGRGEVASKVEVQGIPIEKYESLYRELIEVEKVKAQYWENVRELEKELKEKETIIKQLEEKQKELEKARKEAEEKIFSLTKELEKERREKELNHLHEILSSLQVKEEDRKKIEEIEKAIKKIILGEKDEL